VNTATDAVIATISVGHGPSGVAVLPNGLYVYVVNTADFTVSAISTSSNSVVATVSLSTTLLNPNGIAASPDGSFVYVTTETGPVDRTPPATVQFISTASNTVTSAVTGFANAQGVVVSPDGSEVYVADQPGLSIINVATGTHSSVTLDSGTDPDTGIAISSDGSVAYVASWGTSIGNGKIFVINLDTETVTATINIGGSPEGVSLSTDGSTLYVVDASGSVTPIQTATNTALTSIPLSSSVADSFGIFIQPGGDLGKELGAKTCGCNSTDGSATTTSLGAVSAGEPIDIGSGNVFYQLTDYTTVGLNPLSFRRSYNSMGGGTFTFAGTLGKNWRSNYDRYIQIQSSSRVVAERADGQQVAFVLSGSTWTPDSDVDFTLTHSGSAWTLTDHDDTVESYTTTSGGNEALLNSIALRNGYTQSLTYSGTQLSSVSDSYSRSLSFTYNSNSFLSTVSTPDSETLTYGYTAAGSTYNLTSITYPTSPTQSQTYVYGNSSLPNALTAVKDENANQYLAWTYDDSSRGTSSSLGPSSLVADATIVTYTGSNTRTVMNALGVTDTYTFTTLQGVPKLTGISRASTSTTPAMTRSFTYDSNGFRASQTDWNGNTTTYTNNSHGQPTSLTEASGSSVARTTTIAYDSTWVHLPDSITTPGLTTSFTYDSNGNPLTKTLTDTTTTSTPYSTNGQTRTWHYTWSSYLPASIKTPNTNTTSFTYTSGVLTKITNPLSQTIQVTSYTPGGLPLTIVDQNGVTTNDSYDPRLRLLTSTLVTSAGNLTTTNAYYTNWDWVTTLPDGSAFVYQLDLAHRLQNIVDSDGNLNSVGYEGNSDVAVHFLLNSSYTIDFQRNFTFDALGRQLTNNSQTTGLSWAYTFDNNGNNLTITDPLTNQTTRTFDALNRLSTSTTADSGVTTLTYDAHDRPLTVKDADNHTTSYVYDGFGDMIQQSSPDSGTTVFHYDSDGNMTSKTDAASVVTNQTFDALDRVLTTTYPADSAENVSYTYDQTTGHGKGIGRLTSLTDASGSLSRSYDERGNILTEQRINGTNTLTTTYTYDGVSRVSSITYPSGAKVSYTRDTAGYVTSVPFTATGNDGHGNVASAITHMPFGPINSITFDNGDSSTAAFDKDYRMTSLTGAHSSTNFINLAYGYDGADNLTSVTDSILTANGQTLGYDNRNRITSATSGTGGYGSLSWAYDKNSDITSRVAGGLTYSYTYNSGTNQLATSTWTGVTETYLYTATGNVYSATQNTTNVYTGTFNKANRMSAATGASLAISGMTYDAFGKRITKTDSGYTPILYTYDVHGNLIEENDAGVVTDYIYVDDKLIGNWEPSEPHLFMVMSDRLGMPMTARDESSNTDWQATYTPYGYTQTLTSSGTGGTVTNNIRYPGQYYDHEYTWHYNGFRTFIPTLGRYFEADPIGLAGGLNPYQYANGNPSKFKDISGLLPSDEDDETFKERQQIGIDSPEEDLEHGRGIPLVPNIGPPGLGPFFRCPPPQAPIGRSGSPMKVSEGMNGPGKVGNLQYTGHAFDEMQSDGFTPSVIENAVTYGTSQPGKEPGTTAIYDSTNNVTVILNSSGDVVTVSRGNIRQ
jgi:RHS repeat-associated protein